MRRAMIEGEVVDCTIALPGQLFYSIQIPACPWFLARDKSNGIARDRRSRDRRDEELFIDARKLGFMVDRTRKAFSDADISQIVETYRAWPLGEGYADLPGFCKSASLEEIRSHGHVLTPGRYVDSEAAEEGDVPFAERFAALQDKLEEQFSEAEALTATIRARLAGIGV